MIALDFSPLLELERGELVLETDLTYDGLKPVRVTVTKRDRRLEFTDDGGAVAAAGVDRKQLTFDERIDMGEHCVNVSRHGVVGLPASTRSSDRGLAMLPGLVAEGSVALYESLLALDD